MELELFNRKVPTDVVVVTPLIAEGRLGLDFFQKQGAAIHNYGARMDAPESEWPGHDNSPRIHPPRPKSNQPMGFANCFSAKERWLHMLLCGLSPGKWCQSQTCIPLTPHRQHTGCPSRIEVVQHIGRLLAMMSVKRTARRHHSAQLRACTSSK